MDDGRDAAFLATGSGGRARVIAPAGSGTATGATEAAASAGRAVITGTSSRESPDDIGGAWSPSLERPARVAVGSPVKPAAGGAVAGVTNTKPVAVAGA